MTYQVGDLVYLSRHNKTGTIVWVNPNKDDYKGDALYLVEVGAGEGGHEGQGILPSEKTKEIIEKYGDYSCWFEREENLKAIPIEPD